MPDFNPEDWFKRLCQKRFACFYWLVGNKGDSWNQAKNMAWELVICNWNCIVDGLEFTSVGDEKLFYERNNEFLYKFFIKYTGLEIPSEE